MQKKHMVPLTAKGQTVRHDGKGSASASMPNRREVTQLASPGSTFNDYAKASPASQPAGRPAYIGDIGQGY